MDRFLALSQQQILTIFESLYPRYKSCLSRAVLIKNLGPAGCPMSKKQPIFLGYPKITQHCSTMRVQPQCPCQCRVVTNARYCHSCQLHGSISLAQCILWQSTKDDIPHVNVHFACLCWYLNAADACHLHWVQRPQRLGWLSGSTRRGTGVSQKDAHQGGVREV